MPRTSRRDWEDLFHTADRDGNGTLDINELRILFRRAGSKITESQLLEVFEYFDGPHGDRKITLAEFIRGIKKIEDFHRDVETLFYRYDRDRSGYLDRNEMKTLLNSTGHRFTAREIISLKKYFKPHISSMQRRTMEQWAAIFKAADKDKSGKLDAEEFKDMFLKAGVNLTEAQLNQAFHYCEGPRGDKSVTFKEFLKGMSRMEEMIKKLTALFNSFDKDKSGSLTKPEIKEILLACGANYTEAELELIINKMDLSRDGKISLDEFLNAMM
ncbi:Calcium-binding protein SP 1A [Bulinus truncatus]|nr:Calcium-binding protein SP 1A [Bulinus truncatus]